MALMGSPSDLREMLASDGSIDLALNEPGYGTRVRRKQAWWGESDGEVVIGRQLKTFAATHEGWHVLHSVHLPSLDIDLDAVVVGPAGVLIVQAAHTPDAPVWASEDSFVVNGRRTSVVTDARMAALCARALLELRLGASIPVSAIVVPVGASRVDIAHKSDGVAIVEPFALGRVLSQMTYSWTGDVAEYAFDIARRSSTWEAA